jgi:hypothetical protein
LATITLGPRGEDLPRGRHEVGLARQLAQLGVVEDHAVALLDRAHERVPRDVDPQVHRVERHEARVWELAANLALQIGLDVGEKQDIARARALGELRREALEHPELRVERLARVQIPAVLALPEEGLAASDPLHVGHVDVASAHHLELLLAEVLAHRSHHAHVVEERRGQGEVHRRAAEHPLALAEGSPDGVVGDRSDHGDGHGRAP